MFIRDGERDRTRWWYRRHGASNLGTRHPVTRLAVFQLVLSSRMGKRKAEDVRGPAHLDSYKRQKPIQLLRHTDHWAIGYVGDIDSVRWASVSRRGMDGQSAIISEVCTCKVFRQAGLGRRESTRIH